MLHLSILSKGKVFIFYGGWGEGGVAGILYGSTFNIYMIPLVQQQYRNGPLREIPERLWLLLLLKKACLNS